MNLGFLGIVSNGVAIGVTKISEISAIWALTRRILDRRAAIRNAGFVPRFGLRRILHDKADRAAIGVAGRLAIDGLGDHETAAIVRVGQSASRVLCTGLSFSLTALVYNLRRVLNIMELPKLIAALPTKSQV